MWLNFIVLEVCKTNSQLCIIEFRENNVPDTYVKTKIENSRFSIMKITNAACASHSKYLQRSRVLYAITAFLVADAEAEKLKWKTTIICASKLTRINVREKYNH